MSVMRFLQSRVPLAEQGIERRTQPPPEGLSFTRDEVPCFERRQARPAYRELSCALGMRGVVLDG